MAFIYHGIGNALSLQRHPSFSRSSLVISRTHGAALKERKGAFRKVTKPYECLRRYFCKCEFDPGNTIIPTTIAPKVEPEILPPQFVDYACTESVKSARILSISSKSCSPPKVEIVSISTSPSFSSRIAALLGQVSIARAQSFIRSVRTPLPEFAQTLLAFLGVEFITMLAGSGFVASSHIDHFLPPSQAALMRLSCASLTLLPFVLRSASREALLAGMDLGIWLGLGFIFQMMSLETIEAGRCAFIACLDVVFVPTAELIGWKLSIPTKTWIAASVALVGTALLEAGSMNGPCLGDLWAMLMSFCWAINFIKLEHYAHKHSSLTLAAFQLFTATALCAVWNIFDNPSFNLSASDFPWSSILYAGVFATAIPCWLSAVALRALSAVEATLLFALEPLWAALIAYFMLGERMQLPEYAGGTLLLASCILNHYLPSSDTEQQQQQQQQQQQHKEKE